MSWNDLKAAIDSGYPVAFFWKWTSGGGHYQVAVGYSEDATGSTNQMVYVNDPWPVGTGAQTSYTYADWVGGSSYDHTQEGYYHDITENQSQ